MSEVQDSEGLVDLEQLYKTIPSGIKVVDVEGKANLADEEEIIIKISEQIRTE
jgi:hypothetical protein